MSAETLDLLRFIGGAILGITIWYKDTIAIKLGMKKGEKNLEKESLENLQKKLDIYKDMVSDIDITYKGRINELQEYFEASVQRLQSEINEVNTLNVRLNEVIQKQTTKIKAYEKKYGIEQ